jgi:5-methylcytosine-specific restriction protein B
MTCRRNRFIIDTMNTADQSIALLDVALRRRISCRATAPVAAVIRCGKRSARPTILFGVESEPEAYLDRDHQIGHSYLMNLATVADLRFAWEHKAMPLLQEYFYGDGEKLEAVLGTKFAQATTVNIGNGDSADSRTVYRPLTITEDATFLQALTEIALA